MPSPPRQHAFAIVTVLAICAAISLNSIYIAKVSKMDDRELITAEIGVEHTLPLDLEIAISNMKGIGLVEITQNSEEKIYVNIPNEWQRKEVRNTPINTIVKEPSSFGFTRWHFPPSATVTFGIPAYPDRFFIHNPTTAPMKVTITRVDLDTDKVERDVILVQESPVQLW
ncbi:hypothetical protein KJ652_01195 [Patescibacteria group bacterium]|nr:hypothetical protein [Patescibacteria group bacterium]MBU1123186.1 hypothetical protein [Patescibacteria group bacterium]